MKSNKSLERRCVDLPIDIARQMYHQGGELKEMALEAFTEKELIDYRLPKTWEEYCIIKGDKGEKANAALSFAYTYVNIAFTDYHNTQKHIALMKLHLLRDEYRNGWLPDWNNDSFKYYIEKLRNSYIVNHLLGLPHFLTFQSKEIANEFLNNFRELIEEAGDLI